MSFADQNRDGTETHKPEAEPVRVLIVAASLDILGGQAVQAERLVRHLQQEPSLQVSFLPINPRLPGKLRTLQSIKYVRTLTTSIFYCLNLLRQVRKYDVIHIFSASYLSFLIAPTPAILVSKLYGKKIVLNYHSGEAEDHLRLWRRTTIPILNLADAIVVPSEFLVRVFSTFGVDARAIFNIIDLNKFSFRERDQLRPVFLSNRNLEAHYGVDCVLRAFALIQQQVPDAILTVIGDGSQRQALEDLKRELNLKHGLPVVTTDAGGIPDIVTNGETGFVVRVGDYRALADRAIKLLADHNIATTMARRARQECMRYTWKIVCHQWLHLYYSLAQKRS